MTTSTIYSGDNSHLIEVQDLKDFADTVQTDATVTVTSIVERGTTTEVTGLSLPISLTHVSAGLYRGTLSHLAGFIAGKTYEATIKAVGSQGYRAEWDEVLIVKSRRA